MGYALKRAGALCCAVLFAIVLAMGLPVRAAPRAFYGEGFVQVSPSVYGAWGLRPQAGERVSCAATDPAYTALTRGGAIGAPAGTLVGVVVCASEKAVTALPLIANGAGGVASVAAASARAVSETALLTVINRAQPIEKDEANDRSQLAGIRKQWYQWASKGTQYIHPDIERPMEDMMLAAKEAGVKGLYISSSYRNYAYQKQLFDDSVKRDRAKGLSYEEAYEAVAVRTAVPGASEHHKGYTLDLLQSGSSMTAAFADTRLGKWLRDHCAEYGFIVRYAQDKTALTRIQYEPWHVRYVGRVTAEMLQENGWCMEEFDERLKTENIFFAGESGAACYLYFAEKPQVYGTAALSPTGSGGYVVAVQAQRPAQ